MNLIKCIMRQSSCYKGTTVGRPVGVLWHDAGSGNPELRRYAQPDDNVPDRAELLVNIGRNLYANDWNHIVTDVGVNAFIGKLADGSIATVQALPWDYRPWGCGSGKYGSCNGNKNVDNSPFWIQFEICDDGYKDAAYFKKVYQEACELTAYLCKLFEIDPNGTVKYNGVTVPTILCHEDSHKLGLGSNHGDVLTWFKKMGKTMADVRKDVKRIIEEENEMRYEKLKDLKADQYKAPYYLPTIEKLMEKGILRGKGGEGDDTILDLGEDAVRILVMLDREGVFG